MTVKDAIKELAAKHDIKLIGFCYADPFSKAIERMDRLMAHYEKTGYGAQQVHEPGVSSSPLSA